jgi:hypothetical protein
MDHGLISVKAVAQPLLKVSTITFQTSKNQAGRRIGEENGRQAYHSMKCGLLCGREEETEDWRREGRAERGEEGAKMKQKVFIYKQITYTFNRK